MHHSSLLFTISLGLLPSAAFGTQSMSSTPVGPFPGTGESGLPRLLLIADTDTPVPGGTGTYSLFHDARAVDGDRVAFLASDGAGDSGVYAWRSGNLRMLADRSTTVPGTTEEFTTFFDVALDVSRVSFTAVWPGPSSGCAFGGSEGLFEMSFNGGALTVVSDSVSTPQNCFHGVDTNLGNTLVASGVTAVDVFHNHTEAIFRADGSGLVTLVDLSTPRPGGGAFSGFDQEFVLQGSRYALADIIENTIGAVAGLYADFGAGLSLVADATTPVPGGSGTFTNFAGFDFDGDELAFMGRSSVGTALYAGTSPIDLRVVVDRSTPVPGEGVNFLGVSNPVGAGGAGILFTGYWSGGGIGLFITRGGGVEAIVKKGEGLSSRVVDQAFCRTQHVGAGLALIEVRFAGGARGLYLARV